jgi:integrase
LELQSKQLAQTFWSLVWTRAKGVDTPRRPKNGDIRTREHLTIDEVERLIEVANNNRYGHRDALMVLLAFRHGLRAGEVVPPQGYANPSECAFDPHFAEAIIK